MALKHPEAPARRASDRDCAPSACTFPESRENLAALRAVVQRDFTGETADLLISDSQRVLPRLEQPAPVHDNKTHSGFHH
jgi:hypothetical protein